MNKVGRATGSGRVGVEGVLCCVCFTELVGSVFVLIQHSDSAEDIKTIQTSTLRTDQ